jgi:hypothetical protein
VQWLTVKALSLNPSTEKKKEEEKETGTFMIFYLFFAVLEQNPGPCTC